VSVSKRKKCCSLVKLYNFVPKTYEKSSEAQLLSKEAIKKIELINRQIAMQKYKLFVYFNVNLIFN
jgi:hypothetical protein